MAEAANARAAEEVATANEASRPARERAAAAAAEVDRLHRFRAALLRLQPPQKGAGAFGRVTLSPRGVADEESADRFGGRPVTVKERAKVRRCRLTSG